jgi:glycosyltransferase involved in cell wall biosynthesis
MSGGAAEAAGTGPRLAVAAIMPLYNKRATVIEAIESALAQTRPLDEFVIVDDGSTDGSGDLVAERYAGDGRVRLVRQANGGASAARNAGIRATTSPLVTFLDADDRWLPERVAREAALMEARPDCMLVWPAAYLYNEKNGTSLVEGDAIDKTTYVRKTFFPEKLLPACSGVMVRRAALDVVGGFDESLWSGEDTDLWLRIMLRFGFEHIPEPLVWMRRGREETAARQKRGFEGQNLYFAKHRHTFGCGLSGRVIWRSAFGAALRGQAIWYFRHGRPGKAAIKLVRAVAVWPFFNPSWVVKAALECLLGPRAYGWGAAAARRVAGRGREA